MSEADEQRAELADRWEEAAVGWNQQADAVRCHGMPVSRWMIDHLGLTSGQRALELAAGPGDTGFLAAELIAPGTLVSSDMSAAMLEVARARAQVQGISNVEFAQRQLEWIDEPTASFDAVLCRWGIMLCLDPAAALAECRRVLRPGGRIALAVWDAEETNPWSTIPDRAVAAIGAPPAAPVGPGMFSLADRTELENLIGGAGFLETVIEPVEIGRRYADVDEWLEETRDCSGRFQRAWRSFGAEERHELMEVMETEAEAFRTDEGALWIPGRCLCAAAEA